LDSEGKRLLVKYYTTNWPTLKDQKAFEKALFEKTKKANGEITLIEDSVVVYRNNLDVFFYIVGSMEENELILANALNNFCDAMNQLLK
jgi:exonuclease VII small subunit